MNAPEKPRKTFLIVQIVRNVVCAVKNNIKDLALINAVFLLLALIIFIPSLFRAFFWTRRAVLFSAFFRAAAGFAATVHVCAAARAAAAFSGGAVFDAAAFVRAFKAALKSGAVFFCVCAAVIFLLRFAFPFFLLGGGWPGAILAALCFWTAALIACAFQFYPALCARPGAGPLSAAGRCFLFTALNPLGALASLVITLVLSAPLLTAPALPLLYLEERLKAASQE